MENDAAAGVGEAVERCTRRAWRQWCALRFPGVPEPQVFRNHVLRLETTVSWRHGGRIEVAVTIMPYRSNLRDTFFDAFTRTENGLEKQPEPVQDQLPL